MAFLSRLGKIKVVIILIFLYMVLSCGRVNYKIISPLNNEEISTSQPVFEWETVKDTLRYDVQISNDIDFKGELITGSTLFPTYYIKNRLPNNTEWYWRIKAINENGKESDWSDVYSFKIILPVDIPELTYPPDGEIVSEDNPVFQWKNMKKVKKYHIQMSKDYDSFEEFLVIDTDDLSGPQFTLSIKPGKEFYYWRVRAMSLQGVWGEWSDVWSFSPSITDSLYSFWNQYTLFFIEQNGSINEFPEFLTGEIVGKGTETLISPNKDIIVCITYEDKYSDYNETISVFYFDEHLKIVKMKQIIEAENSIYYSLVGLIDNNAILIFTRSLNDNLDICSINLDGSDLKIIKTIPSPSIFSKMYQNKILYGYEEDKRTKLFTFDLENNNAELIIDSEEISSFMELSKDGKLLFYYWNENEFGYVDINTKSIHFLDIDPSKTYDHQWSPDSNKIIFVKGQRWSDEEQKELVMFNLVSNERSTLTRIKGEIFTIGWIMGGEEFAYIVNHYDPGLSQIYYIDKTGVDSLQLSFDSNSSIEVNYYMACPQVYAFDGQGYKKIGEIITENVYKNNEGEDTLLIPNHFIKDSKLRIRIDENLDEITFLNSLELFVGDVRLKPINCVPELNQKDDKYLILHKNDFYDLEFIIDAPDEKVITLECRGYYIYY